MLPLERAMSGVFHRDASQNGIQSIPSRMTMQERREFHKTHEPEWVLKAVTKKGNDALDEGFNAGAKGFIMGFGAKFLVSLLFGLLGRRKKLPELVKDAAGADTFKFASFFGAYTGLVRGLATHFCNSRNKNDRWNAALAGLIASLALIIDDPERRQTIAIYVFVRAMSVLAKGLSREKYLPYYEHAESVLFGIVNAPIMYGFLLEPDLVDQGYYRWILNMGAISHQGLELALRHRVKHYNATGELLPFCPCQPHYHTGSCVGYCTHDWFLGFGRAAKIYAPVHLLPLILFRYNKLLKDPKKQITDTAFAWVYSCMFLTTYQFTVKFSQCMMRNARQQDDMAQAMLGGLLTGFACLLERPSRVSELMLYCVPKAMEVCWNYGKRYYGFQPIPYFEIPLFAIGGAILLSALKEDLKSTYFNALRFAMTGDVSKRSKDGKKESRRSDKHEDEEDE